MRARYFSILFFLLLGTFAIAKDIPAKPNPPRLVNDFAGMLSSSERDALERKLVAYNDSTSTQIAVVIERSLEGEDVFDYALRIYNTWKIGQKDIGNGVLIYAALDDRKIRFITGYGAEGFLPDAIAKRIIENIIIPAFREQRYYEGIDRATSAIISYGAGEYKADERSKGGQSSGGFGTIFLLVIIFLFFILPMIRNYRNRNNKDDDNDGGFGSGGRYNERSRGGGWIFIPPIGGGGWNSGGGGFGGGGGDFGGFGGGFSGGGGAGGDW